MAKTTKRDLSNSLKTLLLKKPLNKVTVEDIASDCGVSRMTFYYYFADIYDLVEWTCQEEARKALAENRTYNTWQVGFLDILQVVLENKAFVLNVYRSVGREHIEEYLYTVTYKLLMDVIEEKAQDVSVPATDKKFIADFYKYAFVGITLNWIQGGMKEAPKEIIDRTSLLLQDNIAHALQNYSRGLSQVN